MPQRELESAVTPKASVPMTRREARELEAAAAAKASIFPVTDASAETGGAGESAPRFTPSQPKAQARRSPVATAAPAVRRPSVAARVSKKLLSVGALLGADVAGGGVTVGVPPHAASKAAPVPTERPRRKCRRVRAMMLNTFPGGATTRPFAPFVSLISV
jgi:hypothetical protein